MAVMRGIEMPPLSVKELFAQFRKDMAVVPEMFEAVRKLKKAGKNTHFYCNFAYVWDK